MKKNLSRILALALVVTSLLSLTAGAFADGTKVVIPNRISRLEPQLPEREASPTVRTKTKNGEIMVRVNGEADAVYANWLGYGESKEEVALENGLGYVETEGHKYQLGAKWSNKVVRSYFAYDHSSGEWVPVNYEGTVTVGKTEMKLVSPTKAKESHVPADMTYGNYWAWVKDYINTDKVEAGDEDELADAEAALAKAEELQQNIVAAGLPSQPKEAGANSNSTGLTAATQKMYTQEIDGVTYLVSGLFDENGLLIAENSFGADLQKGNSGLSEGWVGMVPFYQFMEQNTGKDSSGAPNYAWIVESGSWTNTYTRAGKLVKVVKNEENTDYFKTGLAGSTGKVTWQFRKTAGGTTWYVANVVENYAEGDIAKAEADYNVKGELVRYYITYRTGENENYEIQYGTDNKPAYGWYEGKDFEGNDIKAETASNKKWVDVASGKLTDMVELDWGLTALKDWSNPPRATK